MPTCYNVNMLPCQHVTTLTCYHVNMLPRQHVTTSTCYHVNMLPCQHVTMSTCYHVNMLPCQHVTMSTCYNVNMLQCQHVTMSTCYHAIMLFCMYHAAMLPRCHVIMDVPCCHFSCDYAAMSSFYHVLSPSIVPPRASPRRQNNKNHPIANILGVPTEEASVG